MTELACGQEEKPKRRQEGKRRRKTDAQRGECGGRAGKWPRSKVVGKAPVKIQPALKTGPRSGEAERIPEFPKD